MKKTVAFFLLAILSLVLCGAADAAALFGPKKYLRVEGGTTVFNDTLTAAAGPTRLFIQNGEMIGENRVDNVVSSARVTLNGVEVFGPSDFSKQVYTLEGLVNVTGGVNALKVEINGKPGTFLTLRLTRPEVSLQANPTSIQAGATSMLSWSALDAASCRIEPGIGVVATSGSRSVSPAVSTTYTVTATDSQGQTASASRQVEVVNLNQPPVATPLEITLEEDTTRAVALSGNDPENDPLTFQVVDSPSHGSLSGVAPALVYIPNQDYNGPDSFSFTANDGLADSLPAIISIMVTPVNDPPIADADAVTTDEDTALIIANLLANDSDVDGDALSITSTTQPSHGTLAANGDGTFTYAPNPNYNGQDSYSYTITDNKGGTATAQVFITVTSANDPPVANADAVTTNEDTALIIANLLANDSDVDGDPLSITSTTQPSHGTLAANGDDTFTYSPNPNYNGQDSFSYTVTDNNGGNATAQVIITVLPVNDPPVADAGPDQTVHQTDTVTLNGSATDIDGDALTYHWVLTSRPVGSAAVLADAGQASTAFIADLAGTYTAELTVHDATAASPPDPITITVLPRSVVVPSLAGLTRIQAEAALLAAGLAAGTVSSEHSATVAAGNVISQSPAAGGSVVENTPVAFVISLGPLPLPLASLTAVPDLVSAGQAVTLSWTTTNAEQAAITPEIGAVPLNGARTVNPTQTTTYTLTATGPGGTVSTTTLVTVQPAVQAAPEDLSWGGWRGPEQVGGSISLLSGNVTESRQDIMLPSANRLGFSLTATYNSRSTIAGAMGYGWSHTYAASLEPAVSLAGDTYLRIVDETGRAVYFSAQPAGLYQGAFGEKSAVRIEAGEYVWSRLDGSCYGFSSTGLLLWIADEIGNRLEISRDSVGRPATVVDAATGRSLVFTYNSAGLLASISGPTTAAIPDGVWVSYDYDSHANLVAVTYADDSGLVYAYDDPADIHNLTAKRDKLGHLLAAWSYDVDDRAAGNSDPNGQGVTVIFLTDSQVRVVDAYGTARLYTLATTGGRTRVVAMQGLPTAPYADDNGIRWQYDPAGNLIEKEEAGGTILRYADYDQRGNPGTVQLAVGTSAERLLYITYHPVLNAPLSIIEASVLGAGDKETIFDYDSDGDDLANEAPTLLLARVIEKGFTKNLATDVVSYEYVTSQTYNATGQIVAIDGPRPGSGDTTRFDYEPLAKNLIAITRSLIGAVTITDYDAAGRPGRIVDVNQRATELSYDGQGRLTAQFTPADNGLTSNTYNLAGQLETTIDPDEVQRFFDYDPASGRLFTIRNAVGDYITHGYDAQGNLIETGTYDAGGNRGARQRWNYQHPDLPGRLWKKINGNDSFVAYGYDAAGNVSSMTDAESHTTTYQHDALRRLTQTTQPGEAVTRYTYDSQGNPRSMIDPENKTTFFTYDDMGRLVTNDAPDTGLTSHVYDEAGNLLYKTDANDITVEYTYDLLNRLQEIRYPNAAQNVVFTYDQGADGMGRRTGMVDQSGSTTFGYDSRGRLTGKTSVVNNASFTISRAFTPGNRLRQLILPTGRSLDFALDTLGRISTLTTSRNNLVTTLLADLAYRPFGGPSGLRNSAGGVVDNEYGECGCGVTVANPGAFLEQIYTYDNNKNLKSIVATNTPWYNQTFAYDALNRLTAASGAYGSFGYTYDKTGNRQTETRNGQQDTYSYEAGTSGLAAINGQTPVAFTSYADGAIASKGELSFLYDQESRLIRVQKNGATVADYLYNALNQRVSKKVQTTTTLFLYDFDGNLIAEAGANGTITAEYLYMGGNRLAMEDTASGKIYTYLNDRLGTPRLMTDSTNTVIWEAMYKPFGEATVNPKSSVVSNFRFMGQYYDAETGLHYNYHRYYDPQAGRYLSPDPIGLRGGINLFQYANANPLRFIDPTGLEVTMVCRKVDDWRTDLMGGMKHCSVFVWHWEKDCDSGYSRKVIDKQYSIAANKIPFRQGSDSYTYKEDTKAFNSPGGGNEHHLIPPPTGTTQDEFDQSVIDSGDSYNSVENYSAFGGPNSNTAADNIIENAGGTCPNVDGAWRQNYGE